MQHEGKDKESILYVEPWAKSVSELEKANKSFLFILKKNNTLT